MINVEVVFEVIGYSTAPVPLKLIAFVFYSLKKKLKKELTKKTSVSPKIVQQERKKSFAFLSAIFSFGFN